ncbi:glycosyltransferase [Natronoflexus pectinivorans]|uniref:glycosyltransferase n=1 Tax=Natronoflexus pectinivorans TaxID=682526 RepID=UPI00293942A5|nr:glycosyltransferase [Natronoflexus pectinivorans]
MFSAQATGRPVITSNISSMPEVAGNGACFVNPYDENDMREGVLKIINNKDYRETLIKNGLNNTERFQPAEVAAQYAAIYEEIYSSIK